MLWQGSIAGMDAALDYFKADKAFSMSKMREVGILILLALVLGYALAALQILYNQHWQIYYLVPCHLVQYLPYDVIDRQLTLFNKVSFLYVYEWQSLKCFCILHNVKLCN